MNRFFRFLPDVLLKAAIRAEAMAQEEPEEPHEIPLTSLAEMLAPRIHIGTMIVLRSGLVVGARVHAMSMVAMMHRAQREGDDEEAEQVAADIIRLATESAELEA